MSRECRPLLIEATVRPVRSRSGARRVGFTLIELLITIVVIGILAWVFTARI